MGAVQKLSTIAQKNKPIEEEENNNLANKDDFIRELRDQLKLLEKAVTSNEHFLIMRVLRTFPQTRRKLTSYALRTVALLIYPTTEERKHIFTFMAAPVGGEPPYNAEMIGKVVPTKTPIPEVDAYFNLLVVAKLIDDKNYKTASKCVTELVSRVKNRNSFSLDLINARIYFFYSYVAELTDCMATVRPFLHDMLCTAVLRNQVESQAVLIHCLLRNYLHYSLYDQAEKLVRKTTFPVAAGNNEWARYLYYLGRIEASQLNYSGAHKHMNEALRKAPQVTAVGFRQTVNKFFIVVQLLLGNIPERKVFRQAELREPLAPYLQLTQAVRLGDLQRFGTVLGDHGVKFQKDGTYTLILRLRQNVVKTALREFGLAYSCISLDDIAKRLMLDSADDAADVVAKAIHDGVIEGKLDPVKRCLCCKETTDLYVTREPTLALQERTTFCLGLQVQSVKAMRYPNKKDMDKETVEEMLEREQEELELAEEEADDDSI